MKNSPLFWLVAVLGLGLLINSTFFIVDQRERAVVKQMGELLPRDYSPGLHVKVPFIQSVERFDGRILSMDNQAENFLTVEKKNVEVDFFVKWRIANAITYYQATRGSSASAMDLMSGIINRSLRDEFGSRTIQQAVSGERDEIMSALSKNISSKVKDLGIQVLDVRVKSINLPKEVTESVYDRMRAERTRVASDLRARGAEEAEKIRAEADRGAQTSIADSYRDAEKIRGEGDAKAAEIYAKAYGQDPEFYAFYRSLNIYRDAFSSKKDVMVLEPKGEFFRYFKGTGK
ncbi:MAG: protease modulator HflC [Cupriavidus sp.]|nr:MAG: protease modulator HflC [Cupriavidus sp.]